ncbi:methylated-DNA--[protein]-cysteine S-methyltransferase [Pantoea sp. JKS000250]|uniref:methylated-DNA--[protein]-cysteine S-methyltransferase n=1 Tax=Pantoea sp. JKS000250 TaxID=1938795 RepID=UPI000D763067|nr:methylated-DNA--[protein]-cysteine S-methyltransferase [Pantoea sp. JKS000250]PXW21583.1 methylated-DNA-[protein]-cysteine S-methyltransferase [Pantoea sp. JKS000250]
MYYFKPIATPVGELKLVASDSGLAGILWENDDPKRTRFLPQTRNDDHPILIETERQLSEYFTGERHCFELPLDMVGTDFQKKVWQALVAIPFGETRSYSQIAREIGHPQAVRAVGAANGRNPLSIVAPCHRVIGANGKLTGFAGGLDIKASLLALEAPQSLIDKAASEPVQLVIQAD